MKYKKSVAMLLCAAAAGLLITGCAKEPSQTPDISPAASSVVSSSAPDTPDSSENLASQLGSLESFSAVTLEGESFTQDDIAAKDATVINFWALTCRPCIAEMPDLAAFAGALPDNVQVITVCLDGAGNEETVQSVLDGAGFTGVTLVGGDGDLVDLAWNVIYTPTTVCADSEGKLIGKTIIGGQQDLEGTLLTAVNEVLKDGGKAEISLEA